jgi:hypothetical protein
MADGYGGLGEDRPRKYKSKDIIQINGLDGWDASRKYGDGRMAARVMRVGKKVRLFIGQGSDSGASVFGHRGLDLSRDDAKEIMLSIAEFLRGTDDE